MTDTYVTLVGGVGGAKLAQGLTDVLAPEQLTIVVNTGDDFEHLGLHVSPDLDTVMYTLAGKANPETGWGVAGESWNFLDAVGQYGGETWFRLGDRDLATHVLRTQRLRAGATLSEVTALLCEALGIKHSIAPMSDDAVRTMVDTATEGRLAFQDYFVRRRCEPPVTGFHIAGAKHAKPSSRFAEALHATSLRGIVIAPSNPFVSIGPILNIPGVQDMLREANVPVVGISPIIAGRAVKGPAAKMLIELGLSVSSVAVAELYSDLIDGLIIDTADASQADAIRALGITPLTTQTIMSSREDKAALARATLDFTRQLQ